MGNTLWSRAAVAGPGTETTSARGTSAAPDDKEELQDASLEIVVLGTGAGTTHAFSGEPSSSFVVLKGGKPVLWCDVGYGTTYACMQHVGELPKHIYVSHNHGDHAGELPVVLAVEKKAAAAAGLDPPYLYCHPDVMAEVRQHRLRELRSTGEPQELFSTFRETLPGCTTFIGDTGLAVRPCLSRHSETCYGFVLYDEEGEPVLGWTADSGYDEELYGDVAEAAVLLLDARAEGSQEHAGFHELPRIAALPYMSGKTVYITGYGRQDEAPGREVVEGLGMRVAQPGLRIRLQGSAGKQAAGKQAAGKQAAGKQAAGKQGSAGKRAGDTAAEAPAAAAAAETAVAVNQAA
ncbi:hypothetical protein Agub_g8869 [Astrephomene gubernaculifera]|uniref:Metallo-beta-lactamase domain-containing protein n=1 Tax=Astrephomene gubernaculifera TaxID=47775 RepID=A0AAD3DWR0_9CHLO|nr:hypothetical protein Agub_g8869 [Astrephomene gubernaculifera]